MLKPKNHPTTRINLEIKESKLEEIEKLIEIGDLSTRKQFFENAITLLKWSMRAKQSGKSVGFLGDNNMFHEIVMPVLESAGESEVFL